MIEYTDSCIEAVAVAMVGEEASGHNDAPIFDDFDTGQQCIALIRERELLSCLDQLGYRVIRNLDR